MTSATYASSSVGSRTTIAQLIERGKTILLTTHYMFEADALCDRIAVIDRGTIVAEGSPEDLKGLVADRTVIEIEAFGATPEAIDALRGVQGVTSVSVEDREHAQLVLVHTAKGHELSQELAGRLDGARVGRVVVREPTLEDAYVALVTGR